ncbi:MAG: bifunctional ornithine acetyltransferase/N-acetylglutamate synthase [Leptospirales bacterium]|nr:bifunctional ornithine acetyltransferase/N-acetylglutamate synthase [Leptospirales bacterium]
MEGEWPRGFLAGGWSIGIKKAPALDFAVAHSERPAVASALFTRNNFPGAPVVIGRERIAGGRIQTVIVNSGNSNVATGEAGVLLAREYTAVAARSLGVASELVFPSSTGVIGRPLPRELMLGASAAIAPRLTQPDFETFARAICTTDAYPKFASRSLRSGVRIFAAAKGAGMIEPNMATMLSYFFTDASIERTDLDRLWRLAVERSFNRISVDSDTSTSDTALILANGLSGIALQFPASAAAALEKLDHPISSEQIAALPDIDGPSAEFVAAILELALKLARAIAADGEGATRLIELRVTEARDRQQALKIARSIINSPLVKTAIYGADPNWGRLVMAVGKVFDEPTPPEALQIWFGDHPLRDAGEKELAELSAYLRNQEILLRVSLGTGRASETVWGCDLTEAYVKLNAEYTT